MRPSLHTDRRKRVGVARLACPAASPGNRANAEKTPETANPAETGCVANATETKYPSRCQKRILVFGDGSVMTGFEGDDVD